MQLPFYQAFDHLPTGTDGSINLLYTGHGSFSGAHTQPDEGIVLDSVIGRRVLALRRLWGTSISFPAATDELVFGCLFHHSSAETGSNSDDWCIFRNGEDELLALHYVHGGGGIAVRRGSTTLFTVPGIMSPGETSYLEAAVKFHSTTGSVKLWRNGVEIADETGLNTLAVPGPCTSIRMKGFRSNGPAARFTDIYVIEGLTPHGPIALIPCRVVADEQAQWGRNGGASNAGRLSEEITDLDDTYVKADEPALRDIYTLEDLPGEVVNVLGVLTTTMARAPLGGAPKLATGLRLGSDVGRGDPRDLLTNYRMQQSFHPLQPDGVSAWTPAAFNDCEFVLDSE